MTDIGNDALADAHKIISSLVDSIETLHDRAEKEKVALVDSIETLHNRAEKERVALINSIDDLKKKAATGKKKTLLYIFGSVLLTLFTTSIPAISSIIQANVINEPIKYAAGLDICTKYYSYKNEAAKYYARLNSPDLDRKEGLKNKLTNLDANKEERMEQLFNGPCQEFIDSYQTDN